MVLLPPLAAPVPKYPLVSIPPASPSCIIGMDVPFVENPLSISVMRLTPEGIVKSHSVPEVVTCSVPILNVASAKELGFIFLVAPAPVSTIARKSAAGSTSAAASSVSALILVSEMALLLLLMR